MSNPDKLVIEEHWTIKCIRCSSFSRTYNIIYKEEEVLAEIADHLKMHPLHEIKIDSFYKASMVY